MLWRPPRRSWCMHRILCTACNRNRTLSFERGHDGNIVEEAYRGRYARQRLLNFWPESSCGYHAIKRFVCIIQVVSGAVVVETRRIIFLAGVLNRIRIHSATYGSLPEGSIIVLGLYNSGIVGECDRAAQCIGQIAARTC